MLEFCCIVKVPGATPWELLLLGQFDVVSLGESMKIVALLPLAIVICELLSRYRLQKL